MPKTGLAQTQNLLPSLPTALPCVDLRDDASESQAAMEDHDGLVNDGKTGNHHQQNASA